MFGLFVLVAVLATQTSTSVAAIWPANSVLLAALIMARKARSKRLIVVGCFAFNIAANHLSGGHTLGASVGFSLANICEATLAAYLLQTANVQKLDFIDTRSVGLFILLTAVAVLPSASVGAFIAHVEYGANFVIAAQTWFMADVLGLLVITPAICLALKPAKSYEQTVPKAMAIALGALLLLVCFVVFTQKSAPLLFLVMPVSGAIAFHLGSRYAAFTTLFLTAVSVIATYQHQGPAALMQDGTSRVWVIQLFCMVNHFKAFFVAASIAERDALRLRNERLAISEQHSKRRLDAALNAMKQGLCLFDAEERVVARNERFLQMYALPRDAVLSGITFDELKVLCQNSGTQLEGPEGNVSLLANGDRVHQLDDGRHIRVSQEKLVDGSFVCTYMDVTEERKEEGELRHASLHDALTGLPNRRYFTEEISEAFDQDAVFGLLLIDVDHFKTVNDTLGHAAGDQLLQTVATRLTGCVRDGDKVARIGGDEFAVLAKGNLEEQSLEQVAQRMLEVVRQPIKIDLHEVSVSLSIGAGLRKDGSSSDVFFKIVDAALYEAKARGRDRLSLATPAPLDVPQNLAA